MKTIELTQDKFAIVDDEDFERINAFKWRTLSKGNTSYALRSKQINYKVFNILMHRMVLNLQESDGHVDHINGDGLDNRKENLRIVSRHQNMRNLQHKRVNNTSGYRGVSFEKTSGKWMAYIYINGKQKKLGRFITAEEAAHAFDSAAIEIFGEHCGRLNLDRRRK